jgi:hypothetical protein
MSGLIRKTARPREENLNDEGFSDRDGEKAHTQREKERKGGKKERTAAYKVGVSYKNRPLH